MLTNNINPLVDPIKEKYKLMVSQDDGLSYNPEYATNDRNDPELRRLIHQSQQDSLSYHVEGDIVTSNKEALDALSPDNTDELWIDRDEKGTPLISRSYDKNESYIRVDGLITKRQLMALLFLMEEGE